MGRPAPAGLTLDDGALIAFESRGRRVNTLIQRAKDFGRWIVIPAGVLGQVWRDRGPRQARLVSLLSWRLVVVEDLTRARAERAGALCGRSGTSDVVDASVVVAAWSSGRIVLTSDPADIARLDASLTIVTV